MTGDQLLHTLLDVGTECNRDNLANDLLRALFQGYPVENLRGVLLSKDPQVVKYGVWIASELGARSRPLLPDIVPLLTHESRWVRYFAIDCVVTAAEEGEPIVKAARLLTDDDTAVRARATEMLAQLSREQLTSAAEYLALSGSSHSEFSQGFFALLSSDRADGRALLDSESAVLKKFGLAAAVRGGGDRASLEAARLLEDRDIRELATEALRRMDAR
jgi:hypothetical protein